MVRIPLAGGRVALVDDQDAHLARHHWRLEQKGDRCYALRDVRKDEKHLVIYLHREILGLTDPSILADHANGDGLDCRRSNLRSATPAENTRNARRHQDGTSGFKGVCWDRRRHRWHAKICFRRHQINLGRFETAESAARVYDHAARKYFGAFAALNYPGPGERQA